MIRDQIRQIVTKAVASAQSSGALPRIEFPPVEIERPNQPDHGDYSSNFALLAASTIKKGHGSKGQPAPARAVRRRQYTGGRTGWRRRSGGARLHQFSSQPGLAAAKRALNHRPGHPFWRHRPGQGPALASRICQRQPDRSHFTTVAAAMQCSGTRWQTCWKRQGTTCSANSM